MESGVKLNGLDLFSGIGGISEALAPWVETVAYCERDIHAQAVLLSRMCRGEIDAAPIWDDIETLSSRRIPSIDIISGGFPCQDISVAGRGAGLDGERSGLFFEILRLAQETKPKFIFLENVPAIRTRGASRVCKELASIGYDCRWHTLSAQEVGANHKRERWFLMANASRSERDWQRTEQSGQQNRSSDSSIEMADAQGVRWESRRSESKRIEGRPSTPSSSLLAQSSSQGRRCQGRRCQGTVFTEQEIGTGTLGIIARSSWWAVEPSVGRVAHGIPLRNHRITRLGNGVVPQQVQAAFKELSGLT